VSHDLDAVLPSADVVYLLRMQRERMNEMLKLVNKNYSHLDCCSEYAVAHGATSDRHGLQRVHWRPAEH
jgi:aspartate carbamoyltransferase catalytic subunit